MKKYNPTQPINPTGLCMCGCGRPAPIAKRSNTRNKHIKGQPTRYILGHQARNTVPMAERFWALVRKAGPDECWLWQGSFGTNGYGQFYPVQGRAHGAHRVAWELTNGPIPKGLSVLHSCDVRACCNPAHLWIGTQAENLADMVRKGRHRPGRPDNSGMKNSGAKLTDDDVRQIRDLYNQGVAKKELATRYGVQAENIRRIIKRERWKHLP